MKKKVLVTIPKIMLKEVDTVARFEYRNRSDLVREALRRYVEEFKRQYSYCKIRNVSVLTRDD